MRQVRMLVAALAVLAIGAGVTACGSDSPDAASGGSTTTAPKAAEPTIHKAAYEVADYTITGPKTLPAGVTTVSIHNSGKESHQVAFARLEPGKTMDDFSAAFASLDPTGTATLIGGPNGAAAGHDAAATIVLKPGRYALACFIPGPDGIPHFLKHMVTQLTVTGSADGAVLPKSDRVVHLEDFQFGRTADELDGFHGEGTIEAVNEGTELHELAVVRLPEGHTAEEAIASQSTKDPLPLTDIAGTTLMSPGQRSRIDLGALHLPSGHYALLCFMPSKSDQKAHYTKGMAYPFDV